MSTLPLPSRRFLNKGQAAEYLGVSLPTFDLEVSRGMWPPPMRRGAKEGALTWDRVLLDAAADRLAGLEPASPTASADMAAAEQFALEAARRGTPQTKRPQHRHPNAA